MDQIAKGTRWDAELVGDLLEGQKSWRRRACRGHAVTPESEARMPCVPCNFNRCGDTIETTMRARLKVDNLLSPDDGEPRKAWDAEANVLEVELGNGWMVQEHYGIKDGRRVIAWLRICPAPPGDGVPRKKRRNLGELPEMGDVSADGTGLCDYARVPDGGVTKRLLRTVPVGGAFDDVVGDFRQWIQQTFGPDALQRIEAAPVPLRKRRKKPERLRADDLFYALLARDYADACIHSRRPTQTLAQARNVPPEKMRSWINLARRNGFLTDTQRGKSGGELTPRAKRVIEASQPRTTGTSRPRRQSARERSR